jgi:hypothetical protein
MTAPHLTGTVVQSGRIAVDEESVEGLLIEIDPAALRDYPGSMVYKNFVALSQEDFNAMTSREEFHALSLAPREIRGELSDTIEDIGSAMGLLREAINDTTAGAIQSGKMCGNDALEIISLIEIRFSNIVAKLARWAGDFS